MSDRLQNNTMCRSQVNGDVLSSSVGEAIAYPIELPALAVTLRHHEVEGAPLHHPQVGNQVSLNKELTYI